MDEILKELLKVIQSDFPDYRFIVYPKNIGSHQTTKKKSINIYGDNK